MLSREQFQSRMINSPKQKIHIIFTFHWNWPSLDRQTQHRALIKSYTGAFVSNFHCSSTPGARPLSFQSSLFKCHKGGIFHKPLLWVCCGMQARWSKSAEHGNFGSNSKMWRCLAPAYHVHLLNSPLREFLFQHCEVSLCSVLLLVASVAMGFQRDPAERCSMTINLSTSHGFSPSETSLISMNNVFTGSTGRKEKN